MCVFLCSIFVIRDISIKLEATYKLDARKELNYWNFQISKEETLENPETVKKRRISEN
jgi:hypothetical protein